MSKTPKFGVSGFTVSRSSASTARSAALPPPPNSAFSKQGYSTLSAINHNAIPNAWGMPKKRTKTEEEYVSCCKKRCCNEPIICNNHSSTILVGILRKMTITSRRRWNIFQPLVVLPVNLLLIPIQTRMKIL